MRLLYRRPMLVGYSKNDSNFMIHSYSSAIIGMRFLISRISKVIINNVITFISNFLDAFFNIAH